jgi:hypothetical protein
VALGDSAPRLLSEALALNVAGGEEACSSSFIMVSATNAFSMSSSGNIEDLLADSSHLKQTAVTGQNLLRRCTWSPLQYSIGIWSLLV